MLTINGIEYLLGIFNAFRIPGPLNPSIGLVDKPFAVHPSIYAIATSIVFFVAHVSAPLSEGSGIHRPMKILSTAIAVRTQKDSGTEKMRGNGYPEENIVINPWIFSSAPRFPFHLLLVALRNDLYVGIDRVTSRSARKTTVQSESLTRYAFPPMQCLDISFFCVGL